ncbi:MAG: ABC transporter substrate-binding protein, partial [Burkholderiales bacterium]|nr:ABC transporter substrate-binding protein [Burkholderiales bacterium]
MKARRWRGWLLIAAWAWAWTAGARAAVQAVDDAGQRVTLAQPATRIVSLAPNLTELLFSAGAGAQIVGTVAYSDYPDAARRIPRVGDAVQLDLERIVSLRPDLIVVWQQGNSASQIARLRALGIPVYASEPADFDGIASTLRRFGRLAGTAAQADARAAAFEAAVAALRQRYAGLPPLRVFFQIWPRPLMTVNGHH